MAFQSFSSLEVLFSILCLLLFLIYYYRHIFTSKYRNSSIPIHWPILGMLPGLLSNLSNYQDWITRILTETRCNFWFSGPWFSNMNFFLTSDPANIQHIFTSNFKNYPKGEEFLEIFDILGDGIFNSDEETWRSQRIKAQHLVSHTQFRAYVARTSREKVLNSLLPMLVETEGHGQAFDLQDVFFRLTFDITTKFVFGVDPGCLSKDLPTIPFAQAMDDAMGTLFLRNALPSFLWKFMRKLNVGPEKKHANACRAIDHFIEETIEKRRVEKKESDAFPDLLSSYIDNNEAGKINKYLRDTTINFMLAGRDTTGSGLTWFFWLLTQHPHVEQNILDELKSIPPILTSEGLAVFDSDDLAKLNYLHAAICESLRLFPPVHSESKGVIKTDMLPSGHIVKPGVRIFIATYVMARMEGVWGEDCKEFKPERWINEKGKIKYEPSYKFLSFNSGPRTCLGKDMALTQMKAVASAMVYNFCFETIQGHVVQHKLSIMLHMKDGLMVKVKKRNAV